MTASTLTKITAIPAGRMANGQPITKRYAYTVDRPAEDWEGGRSRIFAENRTFRAPGGRPMFTPVVVLTDSIQPATR